MLPAQAQLPRLLASAVAQPSAAPPVETPEVALQSGASLVKRASAGVRELERIRQQGAGEAELETLYDALPTERDELAKRIAAARKAIHEAHSAFRFQDIRFAVDEDRKRIDAWASQVGKASEALETGKKRTRELLQFWERAGKLARDTGAPRELQQQIDAVIAEARRTQLALARPESVLIPVQSLLDEMSSMVDSILHDIDKEGPNLLDDARVRDFSIISAVEALGQLHRVAPAIESTVEYLNRMGALFVTIDRDRLTAHLLFTLLVCFGMLAMRKHADDWHGDEREGSVARRLVKHPLASALLMSLVFGGVFYDELTTTAVLVRYVAAIACSLLLFLPLLEPAFRRLIFGLGLLLCVDLTRVLVSEFVHLERLIATTELICVAAVLGYLLRRDHWPDLPYAEVWSGLQRAAAWIWFLGTASGALAALTGYGYFAEIVGGGMLVSMYMAAILTAAVEASSSLLWVATQSRWARKLHVIAKHRDLVLAKSTRALALAAAAAWAVLSLDYLTLKDVFWQGAARAFDASIEVGSLKLSLGLLAVLVLGTALAVYGARVIRFLFEEDVLARFDLTGSTRDLVGSSLYYVVLLLGFLVTLAAAGITLDRLTILMGALGVGLGFGLQNLVQNLVAGVLLLFGGPIKVRDKIQLADLMGEVTSIGFRASTVRTWQGAEVIVPNSKLIQDQVINWTLSDQRRRIDLDIGVKYGTDPERVIGLLNEVGQEHPKVLKDPPVQTLFLKHGESSLDFQLRAWVSFDDYVSVFSDLTVAVNKRLVAENVEIPFPQRNLHFASVAPEVQEALVNRARREPTAQ